MVMADGGKRRALVVFVLLGGLPLPITAIGAYVVVRELLVDAPAAPLLTSQLLLFSITLLVVGGGGLVIWRTVASLERTTEIETPVKESGSGLRTQPEAGGPVVNSVARMLSTIERQASELDRVSQQLASAQRELESTRARLREMSFERQVPKA